MGLADQHFIGTVIFSLSGTLRTCRDWDSCIYSTYMVAAAVVGVRGSKEFWLYPSTTASVWISGRVMMLLFSERMG